MATRVREQVHRQFGEQLSRAESAVLCCIADRIPKNSDSTYIGRERICQETHYCRRWVMIVLRQLEQKGLLIIESKTGGRGNYTCYRIPFDWQLLKIIPVVPQVSDLGEAFDEPDETVRPFKRTLEEELRYCKSISNRHNISADRRAYWQARIQEIEQQIRAQQEPGQQEPGQQEPGQQEPGQQEPGQQETEQEQQIRLWSKQIESLQRTLESVPANSFRWKHYKEKLSHAQETLAAWEHLPEGEYA